MERKTLIFSTFLVLQGSLVPVSASPMRREHRPWLMIGGHHPSEPAVAPTPLASQPKEPILVESHPKNAGEKVAKRALDYRGTRYRFGGTTKKGLDCSGLVSRVYEDLRLKRVPRASNALYKSGKPVALSDLRPGDLVFFKNTYKHGISHVGVYAGHNKFVHAANRRHGVIVTAMSDPYYQLHYAGARRIY